MDARYPLTGIVAFLLAALFFAAAWGAGRLLLPRSSRSPQDLPLMQVAIGSGVLGYVAFTLGLVGWLRPAPLAVVLLAGAAALAWSRWRHGRGVAHAPDDIAQGHTGPWLVGGAALTTAAAVVFALMGAMLPEVEYDALWYHLTFPRRYLATGFLLDLPCDHMSPTPQHVELLYGYGLVMGDPRAAKLIHFGFGIMAAAWASLLTARLAGRRWALVTLALFLTAPTVLWEMTTAYNELPLAFVGTGAVALLLHWRQRGDRRLIALAGVLLGFGLAGKHLATFFVAPLAIGVLLASTPGQRRGPGRRVADAALLSGVALAVALPWYARAWVLTGNPFFPMFYDQLSALGIEVRRWDAQAQSGWTHAMNRYGHGRGVLDLMLLPFRATWHGARYAGSMGPAWLLGLPLVALVWRRLASDAKSIAALVLVFMVLWASPWSSFQLRYLVPIAPLVSVLLAVTFREFVGTLTDAGWPRARPLVEAGLVAVLFLNLPAFSRLHDTRSGWIPNTLHVDWPRGPRTALGFRDHQLYLRERLAPYRAVAHINAMVPADGRVVWFAEAAHYYLEPETIMNYSRCVTDGTWGARPGEEEKAYEALLDAGVTHIAWDRTRHDLADEQFAIRSSAFLNRYAERLYEDDVIVLDRLLAKPRQR